MDVLRIAAKCVVGGLLIAVGIVMIPLPGPGIPVVVAGIAVLATEFDWAANLQARLGDLWRRIVRRPARA